MDYFVDSCLTKDECDKNESNQAFNLQSYEKTRAVQRRNEIFSLYCRVKITSAQPKYKKSAIPHRLNGF